MSYFNEYHYNNSSSNYIIFEIDHQLFGMHRGRKNLFKGIDYPKLANFSILFFMLKIKLYVCRNLCENFKQIGQKMKKL